MDQVNRALPVPLQVIIVVTLLTVGFVCLAYAFWPRRTPSARQARRERERSELLGSRADKGTYQTDELSQLPTDQFRAPGKLPGQDRLTRDPRTGMGVAPPTPAPETPLRFQRSDPAVPAWATDHLSGGGGTPSQRLDPDDPSGATSWDSLQPQHLPTAAMPTVGRPSVPAVPTSEPAPPDRTTARTDSPLDPPRLPGESRAQRRQRLEFLALQQAADDRRRAERPESP